MSSFSRRLPWLFWCITTIYSAEISNHGPPSKSCRVGKDSGECMFVAKCVGEGGQHLGTCMQGFFFGSCCKISQVKTNVSVETNSILEAIVITEPVTSDVTTDVPEIITVYDISSNIIQDSGVAVTDTIIPETTTSSLNQTVTEPSQETTVRDEGEGTTVRDEEATTTEKPLEELTYSQACGRQPWLDRQHKPNLDPGLLPVRGVVKKNAVPRQLWKEFLSYLQKQEEHGRYGRSVKNLQKNGRYGRSVKQLRPMPRRAKIQEGENAEYGEFPWQISLRRNQFGIYLHQCGAVLLSRNWAITAAHCVHDYQADKLQLRMGDYHTGSEGPSLKEAHVHQDRKVEVVVEHSMYNHQTYDYDIALLRLDSPVEFQPNILPVCLPEYDMDLVGQEAWVTGHGRMYDGGPQPKVLQKVMLPILKNSECEMMYQRAGFIEYIPRNFICAGYSSGGKDSCDGDSGGPLVTQRSDGRFMLTGIVSWGRSCGERNQPGVYTRVSHFTQWINAMLNIN